MHVLRRVRTHLVRRIRAKALPSRLTRSIASIAFVGFPKSAWRVGGPVLADCGALASFFVSHNLCGRRLDNLEYFDDEDLAAVNSSGHEIGSHTFARLPAVGSHNLLIADIAENERFIRARVGDVIPATFAYPCDDVSLRAKLALSRRFACCLGREPGINHGTLDLGHLKTISLDWRTWRSHDPDWTIAAALSTPSWIIFLAMAVGETNSADSVPPMMLKAVLEKTRAAGIEILTVKNALARACYR